MNLVFHRLCVISLRLLHQEHIHLRKSCPMCKNSFSLRKLGFLLCSGGEERYSDSEAPDGLNTTRCTCSTTWAEQGTQLALSTIAPTAGGINAAYNSRAQHPEPGGPSPRSSINAKREDMMLCRNRLPAKATRMEPPYSRWTGQ